jgi:uncharacterized protein
MIIGILILELQLPGCQSLKEKRSRLKPLLARLHREFNISTAELGHNDSWQQAIVGCSLLSNSKPHTERSLTKIAAWVENTWRDVTVIDAKIELY